MSKNLAEYPHSFAAEQMLVGTLLVRPVLLKSVFGILEPNDMFSVSHREILISMQELAKKGANLDLSFISDDLKKRGALESIGGNSYLISLCNTAGSGDADVKAYAEELLNLSMLRDVMKGATKIFEEASLTPDDPSSFIYQTIRKLEGIAKRKKINDLLSAHDICTNFEDGMSFIELVEKKQELYQEHGEAAMFLDCYSTGYPDIDRLLCGMSKTDMIVLACRPRTGKTALALNIMLNVAKAGHPVGFFSTEMGTNQLMKRLILNEAQVNSRFFDSCNISSENFHSMNEAYEMIKKLPLHFSDQSQPKIGLLQARAAHMVENLGVKCIFIDYLQQVRANTKTENRQVEVSEASWGIKAIAKDLKVPVFVCAQVSRAVETENRRPRLSDLRESGSIEQDADQIMFLQREDLNDSNLSPGLSKIYLDKNRHGDTGEASLFFRKDLGRFETLSKFDDVMENIKNG